MSGHAYARLRRRPAWVGQCTCGWATPLLPTDTAARLAVAAHVLEQSGASEASVAIKGDE